MGHKRTVSSNWGGGSQASLQEGKPELSFGKMCRTGERAFEGERSGARPEVKLFLFLAV